MRRDCLINPKSAELYTLRLANMIVAESEKRLAVIYKGEGDEK